LPVDDLSGGTLSIFNATTNQKVCDLNDVKEISLNETVKKDVSYYNPHKIQTLSKSSETTMEFKTDIPIDLYKLLGVDVTQFPDAYDIQYLKAIPVRKHKKKRINKKWLKRYGYKEIVVESKGWEINYHIDGTVEFVKDGERLC
jgi:hypothetical protein